MVELQEYFRKTDKNSMFSARAIFKGINKLWISKNSGRTFICDTKQKGASTLWFNGATYKMPSNFGYSNSYVMITKLSDSVWDIRFATTVEVTAHQRNRYGARIHDNHYCFVGAERAQKLHIGEENWYLSYEVVNDPKDGSYITVKPLYSEKDISTKLKGTVSQLPRFKFIRKQEHDGLYLPKPFA